VAALNELQDYLGRLSTILWNYGASFPVPAVVRYEDTLNVGFEFTAALPGPSSPQPAIIKLSEIWAPVQKDVYDRREYEYDFVEHPLNRRRAFHGHHPEYFLRNYQVVVHEHCEEILKQPTCLHYYGLPVNGYEAIQRFASLWGQLGPLGCNSLRCMQ